MTMNYQPPHEVREDEKLASMIATLESGGELPAIWVNGEFAITGSHRLAACWATDSEIDVIEIDEDDLRQAYENMGLDIDYDTCDDYNELERQLSLLGYE